MTKKTFFSPVALFALLLVPALPLASSGASLASLPDVSKLTPYTVFGGNINLNLATVNGAVGIAPGGKFTMSAPSFIEGKLDLDSGVTQSIAAPNNVTGGIHSPVALAAAQAQVFSASTAFQNLAPNTTLGAVNVASGGVSFGSINGLADINVINMTSLTSGNGNVSLIGDPGDYWVLNIAGGLSLTGSAAIGTIAQAAHTFINLYQNPGGNLGTAAHIGNVINGQVLIPYDTATFHSMNGATWSGAGMITFMSGATINAVVPEAPTTSLLIFGAMVVGGVAMRRQRLRWRA